MSPDGPRLRNRSSRSHQRDRLSASRARPRHAWEDGSYAVALGWTAKKEAGAEKLDTSALDGRRPRALRGARVLGSGVMLGAAVLVGVWGLTWKRSQPEVARSVEVPPSEQGTHPTPMPEEQASHSTEPVPQFLVLEQTPPKTSEPMSVPRKMKS